LNGAHGVDIILKFLIIVLAYHLAILTVEIIKH
jgi:hypothetical protein